MPDYDEKSYEERLRHALRQVPTPAADADDVLERVEHGVRRRVRRRRAGTATLGVAAVLVAGAVVVPNLGSDDNVADGPRKADHQSSKRLQATQKQGSAAAGTTTKPPRSSGMASKQPSASRPGKTTKPRGLAVSGIAVNSAGDVGVIAKGDCADGPCIVAGSPANDVDYRVAPSNDHLLESMELTATKTYDNQSPGIEVGSNASNWWAWTDAFYSTHDGGKTWKPVVLPDSLRVKDVQSNNGRVWAFGVRANGRFGAASASENGNNWVKESVPVGVDETIETPMVVDNRVAFVASDRYSQRSKFLRRSSVGWTRSSVPCPKPVESTSADSTVWLGCKSPTGSELVTWSHDGGNNWDVALIDRPNLTAVGGVNSDQAIVGVGADMIMVTAGNSSMKPVEAPFDASDDVWGDEVGYTKIRFVSDGTGYATTTGGALARSEDGGRTWQPQSLP